MRGNSWQRDVQAAEQPLPVVQCAPGWIKDVADHSRVPIEYPPPEHHAPFCRTARRHRCLSSLGGEGEHRARIRLRPSPKLQVSSHLTQIWIEPRTVTPIAWVAVLLTVGNVNHYLS